MTPESPTEGHARLGRLAGVWEGPERALPSPWDPAGGESVGRVHARLDLGGFFLLSDYTSTRAGQLLLTGHGVYGFAPETGRYTMRWFDSSGTDPGPPLPGTWDGDRLCFERTRGGRTVRYVYDLGPDAYRFGILLSGEAGAETAVLHATYRRIG